MGGIAPCCMFQADFVFDLPLTIYILYMKFRLNRKTRFSKKATNENLPPNVIKQLAKELKGLDESPPEGIKVGVNDDDFSIIYADIEGPGTCYCLMISLILLRKIVRCLLIEPYPESALNEQAGKMLLENYDEYARHARLYTGIHAKPKPKLKSGAICESTTALNVEQHNTSVLNIEQKNAASVPATETGVSGTAVVGISGTAPKKEGLSKIPADKKKMDARKKSLKRL
ncbi:hypothetical protein GOBAR_DD18861 [Gossypium barbadense]|nr:hypothetical protein GOBAR_DD18861 [Gossypium barbadense]